MPVGKLGTWDETMNMPEKKQKEETDEMFTFFFRYRFLVEIYILGR